MRRFFASPKFIPLLFAIVTVVAYGLLLPLTGFYWDDWPFAWIADFQGAKEFFPAFASVRPFLSSIFFVTTSLIPPVPIYWQIFALVIRFASGLAAWFALKQIWPRYPRQTLIASLLFLVFLAIVSIGWRSRISIRNGFRLFFICSLLASPRAPAKSFC